MDPRHVSHTVDNTNGDGALDEFRQRLGALDMASQEAIMYDTFHGDMLLETIAMSVFYCLRDSGANM